MVKSGEGDWKIKPAWEENRGTKATPAKGILPQNLARKGNHHQGPACLNSRDQGL